MEMAEGVENVLSCKVGEAWERLIEALADEVLLDGVGVFLVAEAGRAEVAVLVCGVLYLCEDPHGVGELFPAERTKVMQSWIRMSIV